MNRRRFLSLFLVLCMLFQPFMPLLAQEAGISQSAQEGKDNFMKSYDQIMALEEVDLGTFSSCCVGFANGAHNVKTWFKNGFDKVFNDGQNQEEYTDYLKQIEDANAKIRQAKADAEKIKALYDSGKIDEAIAADPDKIAAGGMQAQVEAVDTLRSSIKEAGETLVTVGKTIETIGTVVTVVNLILMGVSAAFLPAAPVLGPIIAVLEPTATALGIAGPIIEASGQSLVDSAEAGLTNDQELFGNFAKDTLLEGGKQAVLHYATKGLESLAGGTTSYLASEFGENADDMIGMVNTAWDPMSVVKEGVQGELKNSFGHIFAGEAGDEFFEEVADFGVDQVTDAIGFEDNFSITGATENAIENIYDSGKTGAQLQDEPGLNVE